MANAALATAQGSSEFGRVIHVFNSLWVLSWLDTRDFGSAHRRSGPHVGGYGEPPDPAGRYGDFLETVLKTTLAGDCWIRKHPCPLSSTAWIQSQHGNASELISELVRGIDAAWRAARSGDSGDHELTLRHRIFLTAERFRALWKCGMSKDWPVELDYAVLMDIRFFLRLNQLHCHISTSIWSSPPRHSEHCPGPFQDDSNSMLQADLSIYHSLFKDLAGAVERGLNQFFRWNGFRMFDRSFGLPTFWIVVPNKVPSEPLEHLRRGAVANALPLLMLGRDAHDQTVKYGVVNGDLLILRRVLRAVDEVMPGVPFKSEPVTKETPTYLILPATRRVADPEERRNVEVATAKAITDIADLEVDAQHKLYEVQANLEIWRNHLTVYNAVVERGAFLWDALSTHLLIRRGSDLARTHRAVALVHQVLLQAVADLAHVASLIRQCVAEVADTKEALQDAYDDKICERRNRNVDDLRSALVTAGLVERVTQLAFDTHCKAERVKIAYEDQLAAIAHAFDERRAREFDSLQKGTFALSVAAAFFGIATVADTTIQLKDEAFLGGSAFGASVGVAEIATVGTWLVAVVLAAVLWVTGYRQRRASLLGTRQFRSLYNRGKHALHGKRARKPDVWGWLADTSTEALEYEADRYPEADAVEQWRNRDRHLVEWFGKIWDTAADLGPPGTDRGRRDLPGLSGLLERWTIHSLMLIERARRMYLYPLPNLTCLYRCCTKTENSFIQHLYAPEINAVATVDFERSMARLGFSHEEAAVIDQWLTQKSYTTAKAAIDRIDVLGLAVSMTDADRARTLDVVASQGRPPGHAAT